MLFSSSFLFFSHSLFLSRDEATGDLNTTFKGVDFVTDVSHVIMISVFISKLDPNQALRHSKVKLTWDGDDPQRSQVTRRALTRKEMEESDFNAYIANTSSESEPDAEDEPSEKDKTTSRNKLRALLLGGNEEAMPEGWGDDGDVDDVDMEITFTPGLSDKKIKEDETTLERYQRKTKEKRKKKKEEGMGKTEGKQEAEEQEAEEQTKRKKGRKAKGDVDTNETQEDFILDVKDERFKALHEDHQFAIDPSNPQYILVLIWKTSLLLML